MWPLYLLCFCEILLCIFCITLPNSDLLNPGTTFSIVFALSSTIAALYVGNWKEVTSYNLKAAIIIISGTLIFIIIDCLIYGISKNKQVTYRNSGRENVEIDNVKLGCIIVFDILVICLFYKYMRSIVNRYNAFELYQVSSYSAAYRALYSHDTIVTASDQMSSVLRYAIYFLQGSAYVGLYPFVYNAFVKKNGIIRNLKYMVPGFCFVIYSTLCGSRSDMIKIAIAGFIMYYILHLKVRGWTYGNLTNLIKTGVKVGMGVFIVFFGLSVIVGRSALGEGILSSFAMQIAGYAGAPVIHFGQFIDDPVKSTVSGQESFTSLFSFLHSHGLSDVNITSHLEYRRLTGGIYGNVYTFFRRPLSDFGIIGMYIFTIVVSFFLCLFYYRFIKYARYKSKDLFGLAVIIYSMLYQWVAYASIEQISGEFVAPAFLIRCICIVIIYFFAFSFDIKKQKIEIM